MTLKSSTNAQQLATAIIFDMDGVILDSEPRHEKAFMEVCHHVGVGENHGLVFSEYIGRSDAEFWADFITRNNLPMTIEEVQALKRDRVLECFRKERPFYPGLMRLVERLEPLYKLALASGSERKVVDGVLKIGQLERFFKVTVTSSEVPAGKPRPDIFLRTAALLGVEPSRCWVIEDSKPGIAAGLAAGMRVIAVTNTHSAEELSEATCVVTSCAEIEKLLCPSASL